jgi:hypothetical protein
MKRLIAISCVLAVVVVVTSQRIDAQAPDFNSNPFAVPATSADPYGPRSIEVHSDLVRDGKKYMIKFHGADGSKEAIRQVAEKLRDATSDEDKAKAQGELRRLLTEYFKKDWKRRKADLDEMEKRLGKLRDQLARRQAKMDEIVDLQIKVLINEADGMGFFSGDPRSDLMIKGALDRSAKDRFYYHASPVMIDAATPTSPAATAPSVPTATIAPVAPASSAQPVPVPTAAPATPAASDE